MISSKHSSESIWRMNDSAYPPTNELQTSAQSSKRQRYCQRSAQQSCRRCWSRSLAPRLAAEHHTRLNVPAPLDLEVRSKKDQADEERSCPVWPACEVDEDAVCFCGFSSYGVRLAAYVSATRARRRRRDAGRRIRGARRGRRNFAPSSEMSSDRKQLERQPSAPTPPRLSATK